MATTPLRRVFENGSGYNPAAMILGFVPSTQPSHVDKLVRQANLKAMRRVADEIAQTAEPLTNRVQHEKRALLGEDEQRPARQILDELSNEIHTKMEREGIELGAYVAGKLALPALWGMVRAFARETQDAVAIDRHIVFFYKFSARVDALSARILAINQQLPISEQLAPIAPSFQAAIDELKNFAAGESLSRRFHAIVHPQDGAGFDLTNHNQMPRCFNALHESQKTCRVLRELDREGVFANYAQQHQGDFSADRFSQAEALIILAQAQADEYLRRTWRGIQPHVRPGPDPLRHADEIRAWMNDPQNAPAFANLSHVVFSGSQMMPPEVGKLNGLRILNIRGGQGEDLLVDLPEELAELTNLDTLILRGHRFRQLPRVLGRMDAYILIAENQLPITELPEEIARRHCSGFKYAFMGLIGGILGLDRSIVRLPWVQASEWHLASVSSCLGLNRAEMTDIPFFVWFRDTFSIPYLPLGGLSLLPLFFFSPGSRAYWWAQLILTPVLWFFLGAGLLLNMPIFLFNLIISEAIVPIVELFRSCLGYSSMVHIEPEPQPAQAG